MKAFMDLIFTTDFFYSIFRVTTPLLFASMGAVISDVAGVPNIALEGMMLIAAFAGMFFSYFFESALMGLLFALLFAVLCAGVLAFFTPAAVPGLTLGCLVFNITYAAALPLDFVVGSAATLIAAQTMWMTRNVTIHGYPLLGMLMPAVTNAVLVGWELSVYIGGGFLLNAFYVALGEIAVLLVLGSVIYYAIKKRHLESVLFAA